jgi:hypothetical protein
MVSLHLSVPERIRKVWKMESQNTQYCSMAFDSAFLEDKSAIGGSLVCKRAKRSGVDGGAIMG